MSLLVEKLVAHATADAQRVAVVEGETRWSYGDLLARVNALASSLSRQGIAPGDRVALMYLNQKEFLVSFYAVLSLGAVAVPLNIQLPPEDLLFVLQDSGARLVLTTAVFAPHFVGKPLPVLVANQETPELPSWEDAIATGDPTFQASLPPTPHALRVLIYTSGTTGRPKGVMLSEENLTSNLSGVHPVLQMAPDEHVLLALPLFHAFGLIIALYAMELSARLVFVPRFEPKKILHAIAAERITMLPLVPTLFGLLLEGAKRLGPEAFASLKCCISGGASLPPDLLKRIETTLNITVLEGYGLTETAPVLAVNNPQRGSIPGSVGKPLPNVQLKLVDDNGQALPWQAGETSAVGEILVQGPNVMLGYYHRPEETAAALDAEGWFRTGDLGHLDPEGNLFISGGRKKDLIIKAGENIAPLRIEAVLYQHPAIQDASVVGVPDPRLGEEILACVQLRAEQSVTAAELKKFCLEHLPPFMAPAQFRFYDELPKNPAGKILKNVLREENQTPQTLETSPATS